MRIAMLVLAAAWLLGPNPCEAQAGKTKLSTDRPGNLFAHGARISVQVDIGDREHVSYRLLNLEREVVATGEVTGDGDVSFADLPRGYYELVCGEGDQAEELAFGVVTDHSAADPPSGRLNVDGATAWLERDGRHDALARMLRMAGIGWVRERFWWAGAKAEQGTVDWKQYDDVADAYTTHGVRVYQMFHNSPGWTHPGNDRTRNPEDLRDVYAFAKRLAQHYQGRVKAWEVWNEPDFVCWPDLGDTFAGLQKAAYLGFKAGDPDLPVLIGSFCQGYRAFDDSLFEAGISDYFDIFNWHSYSSPERYPGVLSPYLELLDRYACADRPVWLTEAGIGLNASEPNGELTPAAERRQAEFVPKSFAWSLAAGTDRHFFFVYPYYLEHGRQFGSLRKDLSPRPGFIAIAAAVDILGEARYLGTYEPGGEEGAVALAFDSGKQRVLVIWSDEPQTLELATGADSVTVADVVGRRESREAPGGTLKLEVGRSPQYVIGLGEQALGRITGDVRETGTLPRTAPSPIVIRGQARVAKIDKGIDCYLVGKDSFTYAVEVCYLAEEGEARGRVRLELPEGWLAQPPHAEIELGPLGRRLLEFAITPGPASARTRKVWVRPEFDGATPAPSVSRFRFDIAEITPARAEDLLLNDPARWEKNIADIGTMDIRPAEGEGVHFDVKFTRPGDRWCYPRISFDPHRDFSQFDGIALEYRTGGHEGMTVRLQLIESGGSSYFTSSGRPASAEWVRAGCLFQDLTWGEFSRVDPNGKLDTDAIRTLLIGLNTTQDDVWLEVRNVRLIKLAE